MEKGTASVTMSLPAVLRAAHQLIDGNPKILEDPVAPKLIDEAEKERALLTEWDVQSPMMKLARSYFLLRSRFAEDRLEASIERGICQYVILGAGLDTFAYRQPEWAKNLQIYEVDHPETQQWKRERLASEEIPVPDNLHFLSIDFDKESLVSCTTNSLK
jgi:methyltransferase (TIGR00027 family)